MRNLLWARSRRARVAAWALLPVAMLVVVAPRYAVAQTAQQRSVEGHVVNPGGSPISGAIVYLSDNRTLTVESYITQQDGAYRFEQISPDDNYKLWAKADGIKSKVRAISSFDDRSVFHVLLKIGKAN